VTVGAAAGSLSLRACLIALGCVALQGCKSDPPIRYPSLFDPRDYGGGGRLVGGSLAQTVGLNVVWEPGSSITRYELGDKAIDVPSGTGDTRPFVPVRLTGPGGATIERAFLYSLSYGGPACVSAADAEALGLSGHPDARNVAISLVGGEELTGFRQAPARIEIPSLGLDVVLPVMWPEG
jgi:hypothetical protein